MRLAAALALACLSACVTPPEPQRMAAPAGAPRVVDDDLNARLEALQHQSEPVSDDVMNSLERAVREQREKRARALAAAGSTAAVAAAPPTLPARPAVLPPPMGVAANAAVPGPLRTPMSRTAESHTPVDELYARARELELQSQVAAAIGLYREASQRGHAASSQRLMELYADGAPGVARDYRVAVFFKERAVQQGASFDVWRR